MLGELGSFVPPIIQYCAKQFPRNCSCCGKTFKDFSTFIKETTVVGDVVDYGEISEDIFGVLSHVNCKCGSTLMVKCDDSQGEIRQIFKKMVIAEAEKQAVRPETLLQELREYIRKIILTNNHKGQR